MNDYDILLVKKDSMYLHTYNQKAKDFDVVAKYQQLRAIVYQNHPNLPRIFFFLSKIHLNLSVINVPHTHSFWMFLIPQTAWCFPINQEL